MTILNLDFLFHPKSVTIVGASKTSSSVGAVLTHNLFAGGFEGPIMPVNPHHRIIKNVYSYPDVESLPEVPDLAVIATPANSVPRIIEALANIGTKAAIIISAGFSETALPQGKRLLEEILSFARSHSMRIIGPNCLGIMVPGEGLNASFSHVAAHAGTVAFVAQSGAIVTSVLDWAVPRGIGFSHLISLGDMLDVDFGDMLDYLANDRETRAILLYIEAITQARKFMSAARAAARMKPVIVVKGGRHAEGARAAASHTGAMAGTDVVYDAAFRRAGMLRVISLTELFNAVETLAMAPTPKGNRVAILTNGGGIGVLATDALVEQGGRLAEFSNKTIESLNAVLPASWSHANPVDIIGDANGNRYVKALRVLIEDKGVDAILALNCPTAVASPTEAAQAIIDIKTKQRNYPLVTSWVGEQAAHKARQLFTRHQIPTYDTPEQAIRAFMHIYNYHCNQELLMETPPSVPEAFTPDVEEARLHILTALEENRHWLMEPEAKAVLAAYGIPTVPTHVAQSPREAATITAQLNTPVVLKILSPDIIHKSDVGGIALNLATSGVVESAAIDMLQRIESTRTAARIEGFTVQPMVNRANSFELIAGVMEDEQFGPIILFGHGGVAAEIINDTALGLPPLNMRLAYDIINNTRIAKLLKGYRDVKAVNLDAIALTLIRLAQLVIDFAEIAELDINPLLADENGVLALDARIKVLNPKNRADDRLAIRPYPKELEEDIPLGDGRSLFLRPILPEDEPALQNTFAKLTPEEIRLRFFVPLKILTHVTAARFTQIDYDREMALVLTEHGIPGKTEIYGSVRISADPDNNIAEYAILIRKEMTGMGLGILLMRRIIDYARQRGIKEIYGDVLSDNTTMLKLCKVLGFTQTHVLGEPGLIRVNLAL